MYHSGVPRNDFKNYVNCFIPRVRYSEMVFHYILLLHSTFYILWCYHSNET